MKPQNKIVDGFKGLTMALEGALEMKDNLMKDLTPELRIKLSKFQELHATLMRNGDFIGAKNLQQKIEQENIKQKTE